MENVWFAGISSKRYVIYQKYEHNDNLKILKASSHGLKHLLNPFPCTGDDNTWHEQLWIDILNHHHGKVSFEELNEKYGNAYAMSELVISTTNVMRRFDRLNKGRSYSKKIKPFNFCIVGVGNIADNETGEVIKPVSPYRKDAYQCAFDEFIDYNSKKTLKGQKYWRQFNDYFWEYLNHPEAKFDGDTGVLSRKHVKISSVVHIGKESNELDDTEVLGIGKETYTTYVSYVELIMQHRELILNLRPKDAAPFGIMKEVLRNVKRSIMNKTLWRLSRKTKVRLLKIIERHLYTPMTRR